MLEGDAFNGTAGETDIVPVSISPPDTSAVALQERFSGWDVLSRWNHTVSPRSETSLEIYFDHGNRGDATYGIGLSTFDVAFQHHVAWGSRQDFVWGLGYRLISDDTAPTPRIAFNPEDRVSQLFNSFVQDEVTIWPNRIYATLGSSSNVKITTGSDGSLAPASCGISTSRTWYGRAFPGPS